MKLDYQSFAFVAGNKHVLGVLKDVGDQVRFIGSVLESESIKASSLLHEKAL